MEESNTNPIRKLASIRKIAHLIPIKNRDFIELAQVDGWQVIIKKGEFQINDLCVFFEIDSFLPMEDRYEFLGKTKNYKGTTGYRLKTMKMAGALSQGLALPLSMFPELIDPNINDNVTEQLNIAKYDVSVTTSISPISGDQQGVFPSFIPKTDQERIQNLMSYFTVHKNTEFEETLKIDGSSCTMYKIPYKPTIWETIKGYFGFNIPNYHFGVCSRNVELKPPLYKNKPSQFWEVAYKYNVEKDLPIGYAIQGELVAPNIQANHEKVKEAEYYIFDIFDIKNRRYLTYIERIAFIEEFKLIIPHVPVIGTRHIFQECTTLDQLLQRVDNTSMNPKTISEGRVYKCTSNPQITFKVINNRYLLKEK